MLLVNPLISTVIFLAIAFICPLLLFLAQKQSLEQFPRKLGFFKSEGQAVQMGVLSSPLLVIVGYGGALIPDLREIMTAPETIAGYFSAQDPGIMVFLSIFLVGVFKMGLAQEIFFRAFIARKLVDGLGFSSGNALQAFISGMFHVFLFRLGLEVQDWPPLFLPFIFAGNCLNAYILGYLHILLGRGSIIPNWISHSLASLAAIIILAFYL